MSGDDKEGDAPRRVQEPAPEAAPVSVANDVLNTLETEIRRRLKNVTHLRSTELLELSHAQATIDHARRAASAPPAFNGAAAWGEMVVRFGPVLEVIAQRVLREAQRRPEGPPGPPAPEKQP